MGGYNNRTFAFEYAINKGHYSIAEKYLSEALEADSYSLFHAAKMREKQWRFSQALDYYVEWFETVESDPDNEKIIGKIKKDQGVLEEALDCFEGVIDQTKKAGQQPFEMDIINYAQIKEAQGDYEGAMEVLTSYGLHEKNNGYFWNLREKKVIKERVLSL